MIELSECLAEISIRSAQVGGAFSAPCWLHCDRKTVRCIVERGIAIARLYPVTLLVALAAILAFASDQATAMLEGSRIAIADGQWWRILTGHVTHWSADHLAWDLFMFIVLGTMLESRSRGRYLTLLAASAVAISAAVFLWQSEIVSYRGLSGTDSALFVALCVHMLADARRDRHVTGRRTTFLPAAAMMLLAGFVAKTIFEYATGDTLFVASSAAGFTPLPLAHVAGAAAAVACLLSDRYIRVTDGPPSDFAARWLCS